MLIADFVANWTITIGGLGAIIAVFGIMVFVAMPLSIFAGAYFWQLIPQSVALRVGGVGKLLLIGAALVIGLIVALNLAPWFASVFFGGDFKAWTNGDVGSSRPFMALLLWPFSFAIVIAADVLGLSPLLSRDSGALRNNEPIALARWLAMLLGSLTLAWILASVALAIGIDARGAVVNTYVQRNTFVVGFAMGFAVIPIIYTIADDALTAIPEELRAASLACGATPWQTAIRIVVPTALSGIFAAVMIGLGRAVGETMIVVMAAGNTPVIDWNIFSGLRALSANIAVELPEAVKDGTLYRMLSLAAFTLFVMTFIINTLAELVRLRFRKRTAQM